MVTILESGATKSNTFKIKHDHDPIATMLFSFDELPDKNKMRDTKMKLNIRPVDSRSIILFLIILGWRLLWGQLPYFACQP